VSIGDPVNARAPIAIREVTTSADLKRLLDLPYRLDANDPCWEPSAIGSAAAGGRAGRSSYAAILGFY
jgi:hypothetical protein